MQAGKVGKRFLAQRSLGTQLSQVASEDKSCSIGGIALHADKR